MKYLCILYYLYFEIEIRAESKLDNSLYWNFCFKKVVVLLFLIYPYRHAKSLHRCYFSTIWVYSLSLNYFWHFLYVKIFLISKCTKVCCCNQAAGITFSTINQLALFSPHGNHSAAECWVRLSSPTIAVCSGLPIILEWCGLQRNRASPGISSVLEAHSRVVGLLLHGGLVC